MRRTRRDFVADLDRRASEQHAPAAGGVTLATLHAAKGLEWDAVFLAGMHDGAMPLTHATTDAEIEEERRLLYVGMTRARRAPRAVLGGRAHARRSRQPPAVALPRRPAAGLRPGGERQAQGAACGPLPRVRQAAVDAPRRRSAAAASDCPASYDEELFERLRAWRKERADEESVPAFVVFTDATLQLIAEQRPTSSAALLRISGVGPAKLERYGDGSCSRVGRRRHGSREIFAEIPS